MHISEGTSHTFRVIIKIIFSILSYAISSLLYISTCLSMQCRDFQACYMVPQFNNDKIYSKVAAKNNRPSLVAQQTKQVSVIVLFFSYVLL